MESTTNGVPSSTPAFDIPSHCKAGVVVNEGPEFSVKVEMVPVPEPAADEVLIKLNCTGICASDVHYMLGDLGAKMSDYGVRSAGHEGAGVIVKVGSQVKDWKVGDRAGIKPIHSTCGRCEQCWTGKEQNCKGCVMAGRNTPGSYQQYVTSPANYTQPIPDGVHDYFAGPIMCSGGTMYQSLMQSGLIAGDFAVFPGGGGGVGLQGMQMAAMMGFRPVVVDTGSERRELCTKFGAHAFVDFKETPDVANEVVRVCEGVGAHGVFVTAPPAYSYAVDCVGTRTGAIVMCIGLPTAGTVTIGADPGKFVRLNLTIRGTRVSSRAETAKVLNFAANGQLQPVHTAVYPIDQLPEAVERIRRSGAAGRSVVDFNL